MKWESDKRWSDQFVPEIKRHLGEYLINTAPLVEDQRHNTDLIVMRKGDIRIACRVRRKSYYDMQNGFGCHPLRKEFTLRKTRPSGQETELQKVLAGWGNYLFYGFGHQKRLLLWRIGRLDILRAWIQDHIRAYGDLPGIEKSNRDRSSTFQVFRWSDLPPDFIVARGST